MRGLARCLRGSVGGVGECERGGGLGFALPLGCLARVTAGDCERLELLSDLQARLVSNRTDRLLEDWDATCLSPLGLPRLL